MDKLKALYDSYIEQGLLSSETTFEQFSSASSDIQDGLYSQGVERKIISTETNIDTFRSAWTEKKNQIVTASDGVEEVTESTTEVETTPGSSDGLEVKNEVPASDNKQDITPNQVVENNLIDKKTHYKPNNSKYFQRYDSLSKNPDYAGFIEEDENGLAVMKEDPEFLVLHHTAATLEQSMARFNKGEASAHTIIDEDGKVYVLGNPRQVAKHAGVSVYNDKKGLNKNSVGIEFVSPSTHKELENWKPNDKQVEGLKQYLKGIDKDFNIKFDKKNIVSHTDITANDAIYKHYPDTKGLKRGKGYHRKADLTEQAKNSVLNQLDNLYGNIKTSGNDTKDVSLETLSKANDRNKLLSDSGFLAYKESGEINLESETTTPGKDTDKAYGFINPTTGQREIKKGSELSEELLDAIKTYDTANKDTGSSYYSDIELDEEDYNIDETTSEVIKNNNLNLDDFLKWQKKNTRRETPVYKWMKGLFQNEEGNKYLEEKNSFEKIQSYKATQLTQITKSLESVKAKMALTTDPNEYKSLKEQEKQLREDFYGKIYSINKTIKDFPTLKEATEDTDLRRRKSMYNAAQKGGLSEGGQGLVEVISASGNAISDLAMELLAGAPAILDQRLATGGYDDKGFLKGLEENFTDSSELLELATGAVKRSAYTEGKSVVSKGKSYIVDKNGLVYDSTTNILMDGIIPDKQIKEIQELSKDVKETELNWSGGATAQGLVSTIVSLFGLIRASGKVKGKLNLKDSKRAASLAMGITSTVSGVSGSVEDIRSQLVASGMSEKEALEVSVNAGQAIASLDGLFSMLAGGNEKLLTGFTAIKDQIKNLAIKEGSKRFTRKQFFDKGKELVKENLKEVAIEEIPVYVSEKGVNYLVNREIGNSVLDDNITKAGVVETVLMTIGATSSLGARNLLSGNKRSDLVRLAASNVSELQSTLDALVKEGSLTKEQASNTYTEVYNMQSAEAKTQGTIKVTDNIIPASDLLTERQNLINKKQGIEGPGKAAIDKKIAAVDQQLESLYKKDQEQARAIIDGEKEGVVEVSVSDTEVIDALKEEGVESPTEQQKIDKSNELIQEKQKDETTGEIAEGNRLRNEPLQDATTISDKLAERLGRDKTRTEGLKELDTEKSERISKAFDDLVESPNDPKTKKSYEALAKETIDQYQAIIDQGYNLVVDNKDSYSSSKEMIEDLRNNKSMKIFSTESGFGKSKITDKQRQDNPLLRDSGFKDSNGETLLVNDIFRFVHDFFGHSKVGNSFGPKGEEIAWQVHSQMYSPEARRAMTTETRGQNSWVNFSGANKEAFSIRSEARKLRNQANKTTDKAEKIKLLEEAEKKTEQAYAAMKFADQKIGLLPDEFVFEEGPTDTQKKRVDSIIDGIIDKTKSRNTGKSTDPKKIFKNTLSYLQESKVYEESTDIQREEMVRELRKKLGLKTKKAPSLNKITGKKKEKRTVDVYASLKSQIRLDQKSAKIVIKDINKRRKDLSLRIKEMNKAGKITANQSQVIINRLSVTNLHNDSSVESFIKYMDKVYSNAAYADNILRSNKKRKLAKRNIKTKMGTAKSTYNTLNKLFSIDAKMIPQKSLKKYNELLDQIGVNKKVLPLSDASNINSIAKDILNDINNEVSQIPNLQEVFNSFSDKVIVKGKVSFSDTVKKMIEAGVIRESELELMKKFKKDIFQEEVTEKEKNEGVVYQFKNNNVVGELELASAKNFISLVNDNISIIDGLSYQQKLNIQNVIDNIDAGFFPSYANSLINEIESEIASKKLVPVVKKAGGLFIDRVIAGAKSFIIRDKTSAELRIRQNPLSDIDNVLGNKNKKDIYNNVHGKAAKSLAAMETDIEVLNEQLIEAENLLSRQFKRNSNSISKSKAKIMAYLLQREYDSNPNSKKVFKAIEAINEAINKYRSKETEKYSKKDIEIFKEIIKEFEVDGDISAIKILMSFSKREKQAIDIIDKVNKSIEDKALYTASVIRGVRPDMVNNYVHHSVISLKKDSKPEDLVSEKFNQFKSFSTKAGTLVERTPGVKALNFDPIFSTMSGAKQTLMDFHMTDTARVVGKTLDKIKKEILSDKGSTEQQIDIANALESSFDTAMRLVFDKNYTNKGLNFFGNLKGLGYKAMLASVPRAGAEFASNLAYASLVNPSQMIKAVRNHKKYLNSNIGRDVMQVLRSEQTGKLFSKEITGKTADVGLVPGSNILSKTNASNDVVNKYKQILSYIKSGTTKPIESVAETLISTPDKAISRPIWFGTLSTEFKKITGKEIDLEAIQRKDVDYLDKNKDALDKATKKADTEVTNASTSVNMFNGVLKNKIDPKEKMKFLRELNGFMSNFMIYEFTTARAGVIALVNKGELSKSKGARLIAGTTLRMSLYVTTLRVLTTMFDQAVKSMIGLDDEEEEVDYLSLTKRQFVGSMLSTMVGRNLGNFAKEPINMGMEYINENYLQDLRNGEDYDRYKHSIGYSMLSKDDLKSKSIPELMLTNLSGPYAPVLKTLVRSAKMAQTLVNDRSSDKSKEKALRELEQRMVLEGLGNFGMIPLYKDVRRIFMSEFYKKPKLRKKRTMYFGE